VTWLDAGHPAAALLGLVLGVLAGWGCPALIRNVPEPEPEPEPADTAAEVDAAPVTPRPKELYADIADLPGLAWKTSVASGVGGAVVGASVGLEWPLLFLLPLVPVCVALSVIDWRTKLLPKRLVLPAHAAVLVLAGAAAALDQDAGAYLRALIGMVVVRSIFWMLWWIRSSGMGFGDVRLSALLGFVLAHLGWGELLVGIYASFLLFTVPGVLLAVIRRDRSFLRSSFPFGPFMVAGALVGVALGAWTLESLGY
jgi:leader peptidase (prepilin peptidase)/N-methyltransferase